MTHTSNKSMWQSILQEILTMVDNNVSILEWISTAHVCPLLPHQSQLQGLLKIQHLLGLTLVQLTKKKSKRWDLKLCCIFWNFPGFKLNCFFMYTKIISPLELCPGWRYSPIVRVFASYTQNPWLNSQHHINQELLCLSLIPALGGMKVGWAGV